MEQINMFDTFDDAKKKATHAQLQILLAEINSYNIQMTGLEMSRDSALRQVYDLLISIPMEHRKDFTRCCMADEQNMMIEAIAKHAAESYIYGARPKGVVN